MGESPGLGGYPDLAKPETRATQAWRHMWTQLLIRVPNQTHTARQQIRATRAVLARRRR